MTQKKSTQIALQQLPWVGLPDYELGQFEGKAFELTAQMLIPAITTKSSDHIAFDLPLFLTGGAFLFIIISSGYI